MVGQHVSKWWIEQGAPDWALRQLTQEHCPCLLPVLRRFLEKEPHRFIDRLWYLQHDLLHTQSTYSYPHFLQTLIAACHTT